MRYVREAPLRSLTGKYLHGSGVAGAQPPVAPAALAGAAASSARGSNDTAGTRVLEATMLNAAGLRALRAHTEAAESEAKSLELLVSKLGARVDALQLDSAPGYVTSDGGNGPIHVAANNYKTCLRSLGHKMRSEIRAHSPRPYDSDPCDVVWAQAL